MSFLSKLLRRISPPTDPAANAQAEAEKQLSRAEREAEIERQAARMGPRGIPGLPTDYDDPRH